MWLREAAGGFELRSLGLDGEVRTLATGVRVPELELAFTPDCRWVAYARTASCAVYLSALDGGETRALETGLPLPADPAVTEGQGGVVLGFSSGPERWIHLLDARDLVPGEGAPQ